MTKNGVKFGWMAERNEAFQQLNEALRAMPISKYMAILQEMVACNVKIGRICFFLSTDNQEQVIAKRIRA